MIIKTVILVAMWISAAGYSVWWYLHRLTRLRTNAFSLAVGAVTNFFDTLGIGSYATTTAALRFRRSIRDADLPGTLNAGHCLPVIVQALIFIASVNVGAVTLFAMIAAAVFGAWIGASIVSGLPVRIVRFAMAAALLVAAVLFAMINLDILPGGGTATDLSGSRLAIAVTANALFGVLCTIGIGLYAPCLITLSLLGMNPLAAFPIMMGSGALLMPIAGGRFLATGKVDQKIALGLTLGGIPGVLIAAYLVKSMPLSLLRWLVIGVVVYTAVQLLRTNRSERRHISGALVAASGTTLEEYTK
jgi:uncharacterized membrane protein YfcA